MNWPCWTRARAAPFTAGAEAERLEKVGRFADAARVREAMVDLARASNPDLLASALLAQAALTHVLAGDRAGPVRLAANAKVNSDKRRADGKPDANPSELVELTDLYAIVDTAGQGDAKSARRLFAARSQWVSPSFGSVLEVNRRLRRGAATDELIGGLKPTPDELWKERADTELAALLAKSRDQQGFVIVPLAAVGTLAARILTGNRGAPGLPDPLFNDADAVIAALSPVIPSSDTLAKRAAASKPG